MTDRREGRRVYYSLDRDAIGELEAFFREAGTTQGSFGIGSRCHA